jgi:Choline dehydrogenase and related flavoproteins
MAGLQLQDWGVTYDEMEPYYDRFERIAGTSGYAGNLKGEKRAGGNVFEGERQRDYPTPPLKDTHWMSKYRKTTERMGYNPFTVPAGNLSQAYVNPLGVSMGPCTYCGFCDFHGCGNFSKSSPQACILPVLMRRPNFTLLTETEVLHAVKHEDGKTVTGVKFVTQDGVEGFQPADVVCFTAYQMDNVRLMLLSGVGEQYDPLTGRGTIGRNYNYQTCSSVTGFFDNEYMNPFIGGGALAVQIDDFNGDNFDHSDLDFIGGAGIMGFSTNGRPIQNMNGLRPGTKRWGSEWKAGYARDYQTAGTIFCQGTSMPMREAYLDLDPNYKDRHGQPLLRLTFDWNQNDQRMAKFVTDRAIDIIKEVGGQHLVVDNQAEKSWNPYMQHSSHTIGGAVMGPTAVLRHSTRICKAGMHTICLWLERRHSPTTAAITQRSRSARWQCVPRKPSTRSTFTIRHRWWEHNHGEGKKVTYTLAALAVLAAIGVTGRMWVVMDSSRSNVADDRVKLADFHSSDTDAIKRGEYVMRLADCAACHNADFSGGYKIDTPFGALQTSNISPDRETGIGNMTERDFFNAVRQGRGEHGFLYPAMPYTAYTQMSDADMHDLWAYFSAQKPVKNAIDENAGMHFPYNIRLAMAGWNLLFLDNRAFKPQTAQNDEWNRGKYIVDGPAHCSVCHTARNALGGEISSQYLQGGNLGTWYAPDISSNPPCGHW